MTQIAQNITLGSFTDMAKTEGNVTLKLNQLVHGKGGTWLRGAMNIGAARQANARTLQAFQQAIAQNPEYANVANNPTVQAKLGTIDTRYPLSAKAITDVIQTLKTLKAEKQQVITDQSQAAYINLMQELSPDNITAKLHEALQGSPLAQMEIPPSIMKKIVHIVSDPFISGVNNAEHAPSRAEVQAVLQQVIQPLAQNLLLIHHSEYPLSEKAITDILQTMKAETHQVITAQLQAAYINLMQELSPDNITAKLHEALQESPLAQMEIPPSMMKKIVHIVSDPLISGVNNTGYASSREDIQAALQQVIQPLAQNLLLIHQSALSPNIKSVVQTCMISDTGVTSPHDVQANVQMREIKMHNQALAARICTPAPDGEFVTTLHNKLGQAGMPDRMPSKQALDTMLKSLAENIEKTGEHTEALSDERGTQLLESKLDAYITSLRFAATLENPQSAAFLAQYIQKDSGDMQVAYLQTIADHLHEVPMQKLTTPATFASAFALQTQLVNIQIVLNPIYDSIPSKMLPEGSLGRQNFMDIACGLALSKLDRPQIQQMYDQLSQGTGATLRGILSENNQNTMAISSLSALDILQMQAGTILGKSEDQILADHNTVMPQHLQDPSGLVQAKTNIPIHFQRVAETFFSLMPLMVLTEAQRGMSGIETTFEKDIIRSMHVTLGDTKIPTNEESLKLPAGSATGERKKLLKDIAYNHVAAFLTGNPAATMDTITLEEKKQVYILTAFISQETSKPGLNITQNAIMENAERTPIGFDEQNKTQRFHLSKLANGDIAVQVDLAIGMKTIAPDGRAPITIDPASSRNESHTVFILSRQDMQTMARQDWDPQHLNLPKELFSENKITDFPPEMQLVPQNLLVTGTLSFSAPIEESML